MSKYIVSTMIQSGDNEPVHVYWYRGDDLARAISAMASAAVHDNEVDDSNMPPSARYRTLGVTLSIEQQPEPDESEHMLAEVRAMGDLMPDVHGCSCGMADYGAPGHDGHDESATGSTVSFDTETEDPYSLSDCYFWQTTPSNWPNWTSGDCAGPRVGRVMNDEVIWGEFIMCEHHFNQMPRN